VGRTICSELLYKENVPQDGQIILTDEQFASCQDLNETPGAYKIDLIDLIDY